MGLMEQAPTRVCEAIDALARRFLKECGYKITDFNDKRRLNRIKNRLERNHKELVHEEKVLENGNTAIWFTLWDTETKSVYRYSKVLIIEPLKFTITEERLEEQEQSFTMPLETFKQYIKEGGVE